MIFPSKSYNKVIRLEGHYYRLYSLYDLNNRPIRAFIYKLLWKHYERKHDKLFSNLD